MPEKTLTARYCQIFYSNHEHKSDTLNLISANRCGGARLAAGMQNINNWQQDQQYFMYYLANEHRKVFM